MARNWPFSLDLLPVDGITDPTASIELIKGRLVNTLTIIDGVLQMPSGLPGDLKQAIFNVRFHVVTGIALANGALRLGYSYMELAASVDGLQAAVDSHINELHKALPIWRAWLTNARGLGDDALPPLVRSKFLAALSQPVNTGDYVGAGLATTGLFGLARLRNAFGTTGINPPVPEVVSNLSSITALAVIAGLGWLIFRKGR